MARRTKPSKSRPQHYEKWGIRADHWDMVQAASVHLTGGKPVVLAQELLDWAIIEHLPTLLGLGFATAPDDHRRLVLERAGDGPKLEGKGFPRHLIRSWVMAAGEGGGR